MMEYCKAGIVGIESARNRFIVSLPHKSSLHYSNTPGKAPEVLYDQQTNLGKLNTDTD
jgi:hypothetical protein